MRLNAEHRAFNQGRGTHADYWPQVQNQKWSHLTTPIIPNVKPLPGREQDNQRRWVGKCNTVLPWFEPYLEKKQKEWESSSEAPSKYQLGTFFEIIPMEHIYIN